MRTNFLEMFLDKFLNNKRETDRDSVIIQQAEQQNKQRNARYTTKKEN